MNVRFLTESRPISSNNSLFDAIDSICSGKYGGLNAIIRSLKGRKKFDSRIQRRQYPYSVCLADGKPGNWFASDYWLCFSCSYYDRFSRRDKINVFVFLIGLDGKGKDNGEFKTTRESIPADADGSEISLKARNLVKKLSRMPDEKLEEFMDSEAFKGWLK